MNLLRNAAGLTRRIVRPNWTLSKRPGSPILFVICMLTIVAVSIPIAHSSCEYNQRTRQGLNAAAVYFQHRAKASEERMRLDSPKLAALDSKAAAAARAAAAQLRVAPLSCSLPFPPVR